MDSFKCHSVYNQELQFVLFSKYYYNHQIENAWQESQGIPGTRRFITAFTISEKIPSSELVEISSHPHSHVFKIRYNVNLSFIEIQVLGFNVANSS
jgi:hypothetical protein